MLNQNSEKFWQDFFSLEFLIQDVRQDFGLLSLVLKELSLLAKKELTSKKTRNCPQFTSRSLVNVAGFLINMRL